LLVTEASEAARRWRTSGGVSAQKGDGTGAIGNRRRVGGVGSFARGGAAFYKAEARQGAGVYFIRRRRGEEPGCLHWPALKELQCPGLKAPITGGVKRVVPFIGEMKEG
jgi:hypothetical protein